MEIAKPLQFFYFATFIFSAATSCNNLETLSSISVVFRHGDRTPDSYPKEFYPNDPYINDPMEPTGRGALTNSGKKRGYQTGQKVRERYNAFLGDTYRPQDVFAISTNLERTKMSLSLVLAGLYPPQGEQVWKNGLNWQPIPINSVPSTLAGLINTFSCPMYQRELASVRASKKYQTDLSRFHELMKNLTVLTGRHVKDSDTMIHIANYIAAEKSMGLKLPKWIEMYFPDGPLGAAALFEFHARTYTPKLKKLGGGILMRTILNAILYNPKSRGRKINLYSVHDVTIYALLETLNLIFDEFPPYGSAAIIELHKCDGKHYLKIVYYKSIPPIFETKIIPGCSEYCLIEDFLNILKDVIPDDAMETCFGPSSNSLLIPKSQNQVNSFYQTVKDWYNL